MLIKTHRNTEWLSAHWHMGNQHIKIMGKDNKKTGYQ